MRSPIAVGLIAAKLFAEQPPIHLLDQLHLARLANAQSRLALVQALEHNARLANVLTGDVAAAYARTALRQRERVLNEHRFARMNDIDYDARPDHLELFEKCTCMASIRVRRVDAFGRKVIQLLLGEGEGREWGGRLAEFVSNYLGINFAQNSNSFKLGSNHRLIKSPSSP